MELTKTRDKFVAFSNGLSKLDLKGFEVCYAIARTLDKLTPEVLVIRAALEPMKEYHKLRDELACKSAALDGEGNPRRTDTGYVISDLPSYNAALAELDKTYEKQIAERDKFLEKEITIKVHAIAVEDVPEDITTVEMRAILPLIEQKE